MSHVTFECWTSHVTCEWVNLHVWISHDAYVNALCHMYEWVMSRLNVSCVYVYVCVSGWLCVCCVCMCVFGNSSLTFSRPPCNKEFENTHTHIHAHTHTQRERERKREIVRKRKTERERHTHIHTHTSLWHTHLHRMLLQLHVNMEFETRFYLSMYCTDQHLLKFLKGEL